MPKTETGDAPGRGAQGSEAMKSEVYLARVEAGDIQSRSSALSRLLKAVRPAFTYKTEEIVPVKITIGEASCVYHVSPALIAQVVEEINKQQAKPFLFDTSVIYQGKRHNAVDHVRLAQQKGFGYESVGAPFIIADGIFGQDGKEYTLPANDIPKIKIPSFVGMLDCLLVLSHATGHIVSGYAGALKNVAMGMSCRPTKQVQHSSLKPSVIENRCTVCGRCIALCPVQAISRKNEKAYIDAAACIGCGECLCACTFDAVSINWKEDPRIFCRRMVDVAVFILSKFKRKLYITFAFDITKDCDCMSDKIGAMVAHNLGIFASTDIVSLDKATMDLAQQAPKTNFFSETKEIYENMFAYAYDKGLGSIEYRLIEV